MRFAAPWAFLLLVPWLVALWRLLRRGRRAGAVFSAFSELPVRTVGWRGLLARALPLVYLAGALLLIIAAAGPRTSYTSERRNVNAIAIGMTVDVSGSMEALDLTPRAEFALRKYKTRLDAVKETFAEFVRQRPDDLIGLVTFGGFAATRSPLTADHEALMHVLKGVEIPKGRLDANGDPIDQEETMTAIGDGLATTIARLADAEPKTRIVILLSDGVSNAGLIPPEKAAEGAAKLGVKVYAIGVGSSSRTPFLARSLMGEHIAYADTTFDESQLKSIAEKTGGRYFSVRDRAALESALEEIDTLEKTEISRDLYDHFNEHFAPFLFWGAVLTLVALFLNVQLLRRMP